MASNIRGTARLLTGACPDRTRRVGLWRSGLVGLALLSLAPQASWAGEKQKPEHSGATASFMRLPALTANVPRQGGGFSIVTLEAGLDVPDPRLKIRAEQSVPRLRDAYQHVLAGLVTLTLPGAQPDLDRLSTGLQSATDRVMGRPGARILLGTVIVN